MAITYLKSADPRPEVENKDIRDIVAIMLANIERNGEAAVRDYAEKLDGWTGEIALSNDAVELHVSVCPKVSRKTSALPTPISVALPRRKRRRWANAKSR